MISIKELQKEVKNNPQTALELIPTQLIILELQFRKAVKQFGGIKIK